MAMIETINLTKKFGELVALNNLNLSIDEGDTFVFMCGLEGFERGTSRTTA